MSNGGVAARSSFLKNGREVSSRAFAESVVEDAALVWIEALGFAVLQGLDIAAGEPSAGRIQPSTDKVYPQ